jgi:hsp70-interacting protein
MARPFTSGELLGWGTANATESIPENIERPDPKWLDIILGKEDAVLIKEALAALSSPISLDEKLIAFDNLQQLVESLDNANDMRPLGGYKVLFELCRDEADEIRMNAFWTLGIIVQNNEKTQLDFENAGGMLLALEGLRDPVASVVKKALLCVSGICD